MRVMQYIFSEISKIGLVLSAHDNIGKALEWIPYDRLYDIKYITKDEFGEVYRANWIDGNICDWNNEIKIIKINYEFYGITQDSETKNYMMVLNNKCEISDKICNTIHFQHKFIDWTSGNNDIDKFIQDTQLSAHTFYEVYNALEWIPYDRLVGKVYKANWI
ncbi:hypothetical protein RirG_103670 [Rhizophagus irregularis DAOM 197198w]|uniref:Uncharacterized protein n=1 Tax=Rhizophagus irregularis (strain DAOM 197198w) TaxID=1432141 RepID=A0A015L7S8_RHIIW|nr:hypothetical protein RirG_103670 [Rhizophagus irregularis DAOM 197198w]